MTTSLYTHEACFGHNPGPDPPYAPARLRSVLDALKADDYKNLLWSSADPALREDLLRVHTEEFIDRVLAPLPKGEQQAFDHDTWAVGGTADASLASTGLVLKAVRDVVGGKTRNAFCVVSPGGHHAEADMALGFCFINHVAVASLFAQEKLHIQKIAVIDIDVHHGNGTQNLFWNDPRKLFVSLHEENTLSGFANETGCAQNILNIQIPHGSGGDYYQHVYQAEVEPKLTAFAPDLILVSAGFDAHRLDPLGHLSLEVEDYRFLGSRLASLADRLSKGRLVGVLEGGYNLDYLSSSVAAFVTGLME
jgi:acetoin utilization deacetylase AcuC-like enzyme